MLGLNNLSIKYITKGKLLQNRKHAYELNYKKQWQWSITVSCR